MPPEEAEVAVVGAGAIGLSIAWRLAQRGVDVVVVDDQPGRGASWAAAGMLAPATEAHYGEERLLALNLASRDRWPDFAATLADASGHDPGFDTTGTLVVARDLDDRAALDELATFQERLGLEVERLSSRACRELEPALATGIRAGLLAPHDHQVDNRALVGALLAATEHAGVRLVRQRATAVRRRGDRVTGVVLEDGSVQWTGTVVLAAGAWSAQLDGLPVDAVPVRPVKGELLHLRRPATGVGARLLRDEPIARHNVRAVAGRPARPAVYVVPRADGRVVVGATAEERGFDTTVTAGGVLDLLREAYALLPGITELELVETVAGLRPATPDNAPLLGPSVLDGLLLATGHFRNGILLAPITADVIAELVTTGHLPDVAAPFHPGRFDGTAQPSGEGVA